MKTFRTHYDNLQIAENASPEVVRGAYRYLSQRWHPDKNPDQRDEAARITRLINAAYEVLSDPALRKEHDEWIAAHKRASTSESSPRQTPSQSADTSRRRSRAPSASDSGLSQLPKLASMNHEWAWAASIVPLIVLIAESLLPPVESYWFYTYLSIGAYVICCSLDERHLKKVGLKAPSTFWVLLVPVYLWQRDTPFSRWRPRFLVWCAAVITATMLDSTQYAIGAEVSGVWTNEQLGTVELVLGQDPKSIAISGEAM